jgi:hypothetical protein
MKYPDVLRPVLSTVQKYGLTLEDWERMLDEQGGVCAVCQKVPKTGRLVVDHVHRRGYKLLPPEDRRKWVRGLCCTVCNHFVLTRYADALRHQQAAEYLLKFEATFDD